MTTRSLRHLTLAVGFVGALMSSAETAPFDGQSFGANPQGVTAQIGMTDGKLTPTAGKMTEPGPDLRPLTITLKKD